MLAREFVAKALGSKPPPVPSVPWLDDLRAASLERFRSVGFPNRKQEDWRGTDLDPVTSIPFRMYERDDARVDRSSLESSAFGPDDGSACVVVVNGRIVADLCHQRTLDESVSIGSLVGCIARKTDWLEPAFSRIERADSDAFTALNTGLFEDGVVLFVPAGRVVRAPVHVRHFAVTTSRPLMTNPRLFVLLGAGAQATVVETFEGRGEAPAFTNQVTELSLEPGAQLDYVRVHHDRRDSIHIGTTGARLERDACLRSHHVVLDGGLTRHSLHVDLAGPGAEATLDGLYLPRARHHVDLHTKVIHTVGRTTSDQCYKGVIDDRARGLFTGKVIVQPWAQKSNARQSNHNLVVSRDALADSKPQLEIYADDVTCKHGSTVGRLQEDAVFYLRSRGLRESEARDVLTVAFVREVLDRLPDPSLRRAIGNEVRRRWPGGGAIEEWS